MAGPCTETLDPKASRRSVRLGPEAFEYHDVLGVGSFGTVYKVTHKASGEVFAMKVQRRRRVNLKYAVVERDVQALLRHPYLVPLRFAFQTGSCLILGMPYCMRGDLGQLLQKRHRLSLALSTHYLAQLLLAVSFLHENQVLHRDLKPENVLLDDECHAMLTDLGLAKRTSAGGSVAHSCLGSTAFVAPEVLWQKGHDQLVDIYGLGIILFTVMAGRVPFAGRDINTMWNNIKWAPLEIPDTVPSPAASFIEATMQRNPCKRLGARCTREVFDHALFSDVDFPAMRRREIPCPDPLGCYSPVRRRSCAWARLGDEERRKQVFGNSIFGDRTCGCFRPEPLKDWDYEDLEAMPYVPSSALETNWPSSAFSHSNSQNRSVNSAGSHRMRKSQKSF